MMDDEDIVQWCVECKKNNRTSCLKLFQVNLSQAIWLCSYSQCTYPLGSHSLDGLLVNTDGTDNAGRNLKKICGGKPLKNRRSGSYSLAVLDPVVRDSKHIKNPSPPGNLLLCGNNLADEENLFSRSGKSGERIKSIPLEKSTSHLNKNTNNSSFELKSNPTSNDVFPHTTKNIPDTFVKKEANSDWESLLLESLDEHSDSSLSGLFHDLDVEPIQFSSIAPEVSAADKSSAELDNWLIECLHQHESPFKDTLDHGIGVYGNTNNTSINQLNDKSSVVKAVEPSWLQWENVDALCWLDVCLCLLVHNLWIQMAGSCQSGLVANLLKAYSKAVTLVRGKQPYAIESSIGSVSIRTGGGEILSSGGIRSILQRSNEKDAQTLPDKNVSSTTISSFSELESARHILSEVRESMWCFLQPYLNCTRGKHESPVFALPYLLEESRELSAKSQLTYSWHLVCENCGHRHCNGPNVKSLITFPAVPPSFSMDKPCFYRCCFHCKTPNQCMNMLYDSLPPCLMVHFVEGLHHQDLTRYDFRHGKDSYKVTGVIQYRSSPDHFVAWLRQPDRNVWMECDDLKSPLVNFSDCKPSFPPSQVHIIMWERWPQPNTVQLPTMTEALLSSTFMSTPVVNTKTVTNGVETQNSVLKLPISTGSEQATVVPARSLFTDSVSMPFQTEFPHSSSGVSSCDNHENRMSSSDDLNSPIFGRDSRNLDTSATSLPSFESFISTPIDSWNTQLFRSEVTSELQSDFSVPSSTSPKAVHIPLLNSDSSTKPAENITPALVPTSFSSPIMMKNDKLVKENANSSLLSPTATTADNGALLSGPPLNAPLNCNNLSQLSSSLASSASSIPVMNERRTSTAHQKGVPVPVRQFERRSSAGSSFNALSPTITASSTPVKNGKVTCDLSSSSKNNDLIKSSGIVKNDCHVIKNNTSAKLSSCALKVSDAKSMVASRNDRPVICNKQQLVHLSPAAQSKTNSVFLNNNQKQCTLKTPEQPKSFNASFKPADNMCAPLETNKDRLQRIKDRLSQGLPPDKSPQCYSSYIRSRYQHEAAAKQVFKPYTPRPVKTPDAKSISPTVSKTAVKNKTTNPESVKVLEKKQFNSGDRNKKLLSKTVAVNTGCTGNANKCIASSDKCKVNANKLPVNVIKIVREDNDVKPTLLEVTKNTGKRKPLIDKQHVLPQIVKVVKVASPTSMASAKPHQRATIAPPIQNTIQFKQNRSKISKETVKVAFPTGMINFSAKHVSCTPISQHNTCTKLDGSKLSKIDKKATSEITTKPLSRQATPSSCYKKNREQTVNNPTVSKISKNNVKMKLLHTSPSTTVLKIGKLYPDQSASENLWDDVKPPLSGGYLIAKPESKTLNKTKFGRSASEVPTTNMKVELDHPSPSTTVLKVGKLVSSTSNELQTGIKKEPGHVNIMNGQKNQSTVEGKSRIGQKRSYVEHNKGDVYDHPVVKTAKLSNPSETQTKDTAARNSTSLANSTLSGEESKLCIMTDGEKMTNSSKEGSAQKITPGKSEAVSVLRLEVETEDGQQTVTLQSSGGGNLGSAEIARLLRQVCSQLGGSLDESSVG